ncbi:XkdX family protein [Paenibacillus sp. FSL R7-0128]
MFKNDYERLAYYFAKKWAQEKQLRQYVSFGVITPVEFTEITGIVYA